MTQRKKRCAEIIIIITFKVFYNLPAISEWNMTKKEKMCWDHLAIITFKVFYNLPAIISEWSMTKKDVPRSFITFNSFATYQLYIYKFQNEAWQRKKWFAELILCKIQLLHNLQSVQAINFRMKHDKERKGVPRSFSYNNIQSLLQLTSYNFMQNEAWQRKKRCAKIIYSFATYHLYKFQNEAWQRKKWCAEHIYVTFNCFITYRVCGL